MAESSNKRCFISSFDEEILKSLNAVELIFKETDSRISHRELNYCKNINMKLTYDNKMVSSQECLTAESAFETGSFEEISLRNVDTKNVFSDDGCRLFKFDDEVDNNVFRIICRGKFLAAIDALHIVEKMYELLNVTEHTLETSINDHLKDLVNEYSAILSPEVMEERLLNITTVIKHLKAITEKASKLKQLLRNGEQQNCLKIHKDYHRFIVKFFETSAELMKDVETATAFDTNKQYGENKLRNIQFVESCQKIATELHKSIDTIIEFRNLLPTSLHDSS